jgi:hypothetical protein
MTTKGTLDYVLGQKEDINGKTGKAEIKWGV